MALADARGRGLAFVGAACQNWPIYDHVSFFFKVALNIAIVTVTSRLLRSWWRLRVIPGPFWAPFGSLRLFKSEHDYKYQLSLEKLYHKYGDTIHIGPSQIVTTDFEALEKLTPVISARESGFLRRMSQKLVIPYFSPQKSRPCDEEHLGQSSASRMELDVETVHMGFKDHCDRLVEAAKEACLSSDTRCHQIDPQAVTEELIQNFVADLRRPYVLQTKTVPLVDYFCAAIDSMAATAHNTIMSIIASPVIYARLREEIDNTSNFHGMIYLRSVATEGMRLFPVANTPVYTLPAARETIGGYHIARGTMVTLNTMALMKSKALWGADAELFRPERWGEATSPASRSKMNQIVRAPWSVGERATETAKEAARFQQGFYPAVVATIIMELLRNFDLSITTPQNPAVLLDSRFLRSKPHVRLTPRPSVPKREDADAADETSEEAT